eukprot:TRINITY_DN16084_c0_g1_i1.p1 TRINITY_DN16084_c0_g1~~TRINITY_DN16084_c0_g1_i1.p1  ORF type:complete len:1146 (+),score=219.75 TRINITY_DN16084_c0_g1_i1:182-3619(+)
MSGAPKRSKKGKKDSKKDAKKDPTPQIVTKQLSDHVYTGIVKDGTFGSHFLECPQATYAWKSGIRYDGPFEASRIEGKGAFSWPDGSTYEGELKNGKRHGVGVFIAKDRVTRYEGQWCMGKRHGHGKLAYDSEGASYYDGKWQCGEKHGQGCQVWSTGNTYKGEWQKGVIRGHGTMLWRGPGGLEEYTGQWEDSQPHGEGTHTWHANDPKQPLIRMVSGPQLPQIGSQHIQQQQNNRYCGQFQHGKREGIGTFYYANGAYYHGGWKGHVKSGQGRHTSEEGSVYEGIFVNDRLLGDPVTQGCDVPGGFTASSMVEDNTISKCTDLSDLEVFALPSDCRGLPPSAHSAGYNDASKVFREVYNIILRHLGELKELYARYRGLLPVHGKDPFALSNIQLWAMVRDLGIITPSCPIARVNRTVYSGPRHHRETAPEDMSDIRPLTPRGGDRIGEHREHRRGSFGNVSVAPSEANKMAPSILACSQEPSNAGFSEEDSSIGSSMHSPVSQKQTEIRNSNCVSLAGDTRERRLSIASMVAPSISMPTTPFMHGLNLEHPLPEAAALLNSMDFSSNPRDVEWTGPTSFRRREGGPGLADVHAIERPLLVRQFLEAMVRLSVARFPNERGLESQVQLMFRELIEQNLGKAPSSHEIFGPLLVLGARQTLSDFSSVFSQLFRGQKPVMEEATSNRAVSPQVSPTLSPTLDIERRQPRQQHEQEHHRDQHEKQQKEEQKRQQEADEDDGADLGIDVNLVDCIRGFGDFAAISRHSHVQGHLDLTVRIKDVMAFLDRIGFLGPTPANMFENEDGNLESILAAYSPPSVGFEEDVGGATDDVVASGAAMTATFAAAAGGEDTAVVAAAGEGAVAEPAVTALAEGGTATTAPAALASTPEGAPAVGGPEDAAASRLAEDAERAPTPPSPPSVASQMASMTEAFASIDMRLSLVTLLRMVCSVLSPSTASSILMKFHCAVTDEEVPPRSDAISLLEFMEASFTYAEFELLLMSMFEASTGHNKEISGQVPLARRLEWYFRSIFVPALLKPYSPPSEVAAAAQDRDASEVGTETDGDAAAAAAAASAATPPPGPPGRGGGESSRGDDEEESGFGDIESTPRAEPSIEFWRGFDDSSKAGMEALRCSRRWPVGLELELDAW